MMIRLILIFSTILLYSCSSNRVEILHAKDIYGFNITKINLRDFRDKKRVVSTLINDKDIYTELKLIKQHLITYENEDLIQDGIYDFAFVLEKDTIYSNSMLNYWLYKNRAIRYSSPLIEKNKIIKTDIE